MSKKKQREVSGAEVIPNRDKFATKLTGAQAVTRARKSREEDRDEVGAETSRLDKLNSEFTPTKSAVKAVLHDALSQINNSTPVKEIMESLSREQTFRFTDRSVDEIAKQSLIKVDKYGIFKKANLANEISSFGCDLISLVTQNINLELLSIFVGCDYKGLEINPDSLGQRDILFHGFINCFGVILADQAFGNRRVLSTKRKDNDQAINNLARECQIPSEMLAMSWDYIRAKDRGAFEGQDITASSRELATMFLGDKKVDLSGNSIIKALVLMNEFKIAFANAMAEEAKACVQEPVRLSFDSLAEEDDDASSMLSPVRKLSDAELPASHAAGSLAWSLMDSFEKLCLSKIAMFSKGKVVKRKAVIVKTYIPELEDEELVVLDKFYHTGARTTFLPSASTYKNISSKLEKLSEKYMPSSIAREIRDSIKFKHHASLEYNKGYKGVRGSEQEVLDKKYLYVVGKLLLIIEPSREASALIVANMFLDLVENGMLDAKEIDGLPMSMRYAVKATRSLAEFAINTIDTSSRKYDYAGPKFKMDDGRVTEMLSREKSLILKWLKMQGVPWLQMDDMDQVRQLFVSPEFQEVFAKQILASSPDWFGFEVRGAEVGAMNDFADLHMAALGEVPMEIECA